MRHKNSRKTVAKKRRAGGRWHLSSFWYGQKYYFYKTDAIYRVKNMDRYDDREVVSNILAHRDYANAYTAQFVIERDKLYSGGVPKFVEENVFQIEIPISNVPELKVGPTAAEVILENIKFPLHIPLIRVIIQVGTLIPIRDTRMIPEIVKTKNNHEK